MKIRLPLSIIGDEIGGVALAAVFLYFGVTKFTDTAFWAQQIPSNFSDWLPVSALVFTRLHGAYEIITGILLIARPWHRIGAALALINLIPIIIGLSITGYGPDVVIRDIGLLGLALDILLTPHKRSLLDRLHQI